MVSEELPEAPVREAGEPLSDAALSDELQELAQQPLPAFEDDASEWRERLEPVFEFIQDIPASTVEQVAYTFRRARIRKTAQPGQPANFQFRLLDDLEAAPELYWGQPVAFHGYITKLHPLPVAEERESDAPTDWQQGWLQLWNDDRSVRFVIQSRPEDFPTGDSLREPATVMGYAFPLDSKTESSPKPLIVTRRLRRYQAELDERLLDDVKDRAIGIREEEYEAYYRTLLQSKLVDHAAQEKRAADFWRKRRQTLKRPRPLFVDLFKTLSDDPGIYRGQSVTMTGTLRKLRQMEVDPLNDYGIDTLYEAWLFAEDSQSNPTVIVFTEKPEDLPEGDNLSVSAQVTGYVFKMYGYQAQDTLRVAPMLLAKTMQRVTYQTAQPFPMAWVAAALALLCLGIALFVWSSYRQDKAFHEQKSALDKADEPPRFDNLPPD